MYFYHTTVIQLIFCLSLSSICSFNLRNFIYSYHRKPAKFSISSLKCVHSKKSKSIYINNRIARCVWRLNCVHDDADSEIQHDVINLRSKYMKVFEHENSLSASVCASIIKDAESYASSHNGWTTNRHKAYPTTDLPLDSIYSEFSSIHGLINCEILPQIASSYNLNEEYLRIGELFVAKYEFNEKKQSGLGAHVDGTPWSFVVTLNDPRKDFTGGGTFFVNESKLYRPEAVGTAVVFSGKNEHLGVPLTSGIRYILTGFCNYIGPHTSHENFMNNYDALYDGSAGLGESINMFSNNSDRRGIHTGDILRGVWIYNENIDSDKSNGDVADGTFVLIDDLEVEAVHELIHESAFNSKGRECSVLIERDNLLDDSVRNEEQRHVCKKSSRLLSTGNYWSYDEHFLK